MEQTIQILVQDQPGALLRVAGIITNKGANIRTLTVGPEPGQPGIARIVLCADMEPRLMRRVVCEMNRLVQVLVALDNAGESEGSRIDYA